MVELEGTGSNFLYGKKAYAVPCFMTSKWKHLFLYVVLKMLLYVLQTSIFGVESYAREDAQNFKLYYFGTASRTLPSSSSCLDKIQKRCSVSPPAV